jgi:hypothetical protein
MRFATKRRVIEAYQYLPPGSVPAGVQTDDVGLAFIATRNGWKTYLYPGDWIVLGDDGAPVEAMRTDVFQATHELLG